MTCPEAYNACSFTAASPVYCQKGIRETDGFLSSCILWTSADLKAVLCYPCSSGQAVRIHRVSLCFLYLTSLIVNFQQNTLLDNSVSIIYRLL